MEGKQFMLATTRFNEKTWAENQRLRTRIAWPGCFYCSPVKNSVLIAAGQPMFILEMYNPGNKITGIGLIRNTLELEKPVRVYEDQNYNRYLYKGQWRVDRAALTQKEEAILHILDVLLFKGSRHMKRGQGITAVSEWIIKNKHIDFIAYFRLVFKRVFNRTESKPS